MWIKIVKKTWNESTQSYDSGTPSYARVTGEKGDGAPIAFADPEILTIQCYSNGNVKASSTTSVIFSLKVANNSVTVSSVTSGTKPTGVTVTGIADNAVTITVGTTATASGLKNGVTFTVKGTYDGKEYSATVTVALVGATQGESITGPRGKIGRFFYYGGEFDSSNTTKTFIVNDAETPYFSHGVNSVTGLPNCHVYSPSENPSSALTMAQMWANSSQSWNNAPWQTFTNDFQYLLARAVFANDAYLGSFIVIGDWIISQNGKINNVASTDYTKFYPEFVNGGDLCENFDVGVSYVNVNSAYFIGGKTYYIKVSGSSFSSGCQLNVRMYNGSSNVGTTLNLTSSSPSGTITFEPTTSGTYYLRADCQSSGMMAKLTSYVECFVPNYAVDGLTGKTYQNDAVIRGTFSSLDETVNVFSNGSNYGSLRGVEVKTNKNRQAVAELYSGEWSSHIGGKLELKYINTSNDTPTERISLSPSLLTISKYINAAYTALVQLAESPMGGTVSVHDLSGNSTAYMEGSIGLFYGKSAEVDKLRAKKFFTSGSHLVTNDTTVNLTGEENFVICTNSGDTRVNLPSLGEAGQVIMIKSYSDGWCKIYRNSSSTSELHGISKSTGAQFYVYDISYGWR